MATNTGTPKNDKLSGSSSKDTIYGRAGNDEVHSDLNDYAVSVADHTLDGTTTQSTVIDISAVPEMTAVLPVFGTITLHCVTGMTATDFA